MTKKFRWITSLATVALAMSLMSAVAASASTCAGLDYQGCDLRNVKFTGVGPQAAKRLDLRNANFSGANLSGAEFTNVTLDSANFSDANLSGATFKAAFADTINFKKANLTNSILISVSLFNADLSDSKLIGVATGGSAHFYSSTDRRTIFPKDWQEWLGYVIGPGAKLSFFNSKGYQMVLPAQATGGTWHFEGLECYRCNFEGQDLSKANFSKAVFSGGVGFSGAKLAGTNFSSVKIVSKHADAGELGSNFKGADLSGSNFSYAELPYGNFEGANLSKTTFSYAKLLEPDFRKTMLRGINLSKAVLSAVSFSQVDLSNVNLSDAVLMSADLSDANLTGAKLEGLLAKEVHGKPIGLPKGWKILGTRLAATFVKTGIPTVTGTYARGSTLSAVPGTWDAGTKFQYQWKRNGFAIPKATSQKYKLTANDSGQNISVSVTGVKQDRFELTKTSSPKKSK